MLAVGTGLGYLRLVLQEGVPRALLARRWHAMLGLRTSRPTASVDLAGEWKKRTRATGRCGTAGKRLGRWPGAPHRRRPCRKREKKAPSNKGVVRCSGTKTPLKIWWCWESAWQAGWRPTEKCTGLTGAVAPWLRPPKDFEGVVKRKGELQRCAAWWMGSRRESRVARTPVSVGRPSAQAPALRCTP